MCLYHVCSHWRNQEDKDKGKGGGLPYKKGGDACWEISIESLKGTNLGVA